MPSPFSQALAALTTAAPPASSRRSLVSGLGLCIGLGKTPGRPHRVGLVSCHCVEWVWGGCGQGVSSVTPSHVSGFQQVPACACHEVGNILH